MVSSIGREERLRDSNMAVGKQLLQIQQGRETANTETKWRESSLAVSSQQKVKLVIHFTVNSKYFFVHGMQKHRINFKDKN